MRNKGTTILGAAIAAALSSTNLYAGTLTNVANCQTMPIPAANNGRCTMEPGAAIVNTAPDPAILAAPPSGYVLGVGVEEPIVYGSHMFTSGASALILPNNNQTGTDGDTVALAKYEVQGSIGFTFNFIVSLTNGAVFESMPVLSVSSNSVTAGEITSPTSPANAGGLASYTYAIQLDPNAATPRVLADGDAILIPYNIKNAQVLATPGETIELQVELKEAFTPIDTQSVPVASSAVPLEVEIEEASTGKIRVSVANDSKEFDGDSSELLDQTRAVIGYLSITNKDDVHGNDGIAQWNLGVGSGSTGGKADSGDIECSGTNNECPGADVFLAGVDATATTENTTNLTITDGQFRASQTGSNGGDVYLDTANATNGIVKISATNVTETEAVWELEDADLEAIVQETAANDKVAIVIQVDGENDINIDIENNPVATLKIDYNETTSQQDLEYGPVDLRKIRADGTVCWVYNVPPITAADEVNIRITNDSSAEGVVKGTLYNMAGGDPVFTGINLLGTNADGSDVVLKKGETRRITADHIAALGSYTWSGRGSLKITSTLSKLEVMTLIRSKTGDPRPLTNLSTGAHGNSCVD